MSTQNRINDTQPLTIKRDTLHHYVILVAEWNQEITHALRDGCRQRLLENGVPEEHIQVISVPGSFELSTAAAYFAHQENIDAVIGLGCVIQGETRHFDFICDAVAHGMTQIGIQEKKPIIFGVLTTNTFEQAKERSGGKLGNKGSEAADAAMQMLAITGRFKHILQ